MILEKHLKLKFLIKQGIEFLTGYRIRYHLPFWKKRKILFTFDDGPIPSTIKILDLLDKYEKRAIFFVVARQVQKYPQIAQEIARRGHLIGSHGFTHIPMKNLSLTDFSDQVERSFKIIKDICGIKTRYFRPPFGQINTSQAIWLLKKRILLFFWSVSISREGKFDFINPFLKEKKDFNNKKLIILLHDRTPLEIVEKVLKLS